MPGPSTAQLLGVCNTHPPMSVKLGKNSIQTNTPQPAVNLLGGKCREPVPGVSFGYFILQPGRHWTIDTGENVHGLPGVDS